MNFGSSTRYAIMVEHWYAVYGVLPQSQLLIILPDLLLGIASSVILTFFMECAIYFYVFIQPLNHASENSFMLCRHIKCGMLVL